MSLLANHRPNAAVQHYATTPIIMITSILARFAPDMDGGRRGNRYLSAGWQRANCCVRGRREVCLEFSARSSLGHTRAYGGSTPQLGNSRWCVYRTNMRSEMHHWMPFLSRPISRQSHTISPPSSPRADPRYQGAMEAGPRRTGPCVRLCSASVPDRAPRVGILIGLSLHSTVLLRLSINF
jgi:hypothetical protein